MDCGKLHCDGSERVGGLFYDDLELLTLSQPHITQLILSQRQLLCRSNTNQTWSVSLFDSAWAPLRILPDLPTTMSTLQKAIKVERDSDNEGDPHSAAAELNPADQKGLAQTTEKSHNRSPVCDQTASGDSELRTILEENALQALTEESVLKRPRLVYYEEVGDTDLMSLTFPKKLWKIVESDQFASIRWDDGGNCVVIDEESFKKEVLERRGPSRIFETDCMKSFIRQLNLYGFSKIRQDFQRSASLSEFIAEEKGAVSMTKVEKQKANIE